jgi:WD40 repeat protein
MGWRDIMRLLRGFGLCCLLLLCSLSLARAQENILPSLDELEVITPDNLERSMKLAELDDIQNYGIYEVGFNADSTFLAGSTMDGVWVWSLTTGRVNPVLHMPCDCFFPFSFHPTDPIRFSTCEGVWDISTFEKVFEGDHCDTFAFDPTGQYLVDKNPLSLRDADTGALIRDLPDDVDIFGHTIALSNVCNVEFSPNGRKLAYTGTDSLQGEPEIAVHVLDLQTGETQQLPILGDAARMGECLYGLPDIHFSSDSRYLYTNADLGLTIFDTEMSRVAFHNLRNGFGHFTFTPDNQLLFNVSLNSRDDNRLAAYAMSTMNTLPVPNEIRNSNVAISRDGKLLAAYTDKITIWGVPLN